MTRSHGHLLALLITDCEDDFWRRTAGATQLTLRNEEVRSIAQDFGSVVCCATGYRHVTDKYAAPKKVRFKRDDVIHIV